MRLSEIPAPSQVRDALVYGRPGDYQIKINGDPLETRTGHVRRFRLCDSAVNLLNQHGLRTIRVELGSEAIA